MKIALLAVAVVLIIGISIIRWREPQAQLLTQTRVAQIASPIDSAPGATAPARSTAKISAKTKAQRRRDALFARAVKITGEIKGRRLIARVMPEFPEWAEWAGVSGEVKAKIWVHPQGHVDDIIQITRLSTESRFNDLALDTLRQWRFAPVPASRGNQSGMVTFRFKLLYTRPVQAHWPAQAEAPVAGGSIQVAMN